MIVYVVNMGIVYIWSWFAKMCGGRDQSLSTGYLESARHDRSAAIARIGLRFALQSRDGFSDVRADVQAGGKLRQHLGDLRVRSEKAAVDPGFTALIWLMNFITKDPQIMYFTVAVVTCSFILKGLVEFVRLS